MSVSVKARLMITTIKPLGLLDRLILATINLQVQVF